MKHIDRLFVYTTYHVLNYSIILPIPMHCCNAYFHSRSAVNVTEQISKCVTFCSFVYNWLINSYYKLGLISLKWLLSHPHNCIIFLSLVIFPLPFIIVINQIHMAQFLYPWRYTYLHRSSTLATSIEFYYMLFCCFHTLGGSTICKIHYQLSTIGFSDYSILR